MSFKPAEWQVDSPRDVGSGAALLLVRSCPVRGRPLPAGSFWKLILIVHGRVCIVLLQWLLPVALFILQSPAYGLPPSEWIARLDHTIANAGSASWVVYMLLRSLFDSGSAIATAQRGPTAEPLVAESGPSGRVGSLQHYCASVCVCVCLFAP